MLCQNLLSKKIHLIIFDSKGFEKVIFNISFSCCYPVGYGDDGLLLA